MATVIVVSSNAALSRRLCCKLRADGHRVYAAATAARARRLVPRVQPHLAVIEGREHAEVIEALKALDRINSRACGVVIRANGLDAKPAIGSGTRFVLADRERDALAIIAAEAQAIDRAGPANGSRPSADSFLDGWHLRVLEGDPDVINDFCRGALPVLTRRLRTSMPDIADRHLLCSAAGHALAVYTRQPERFDPMLGPLLPWLEQIATNNLYEQLRRQKRHLVHEVALDLQFVRVPVKPVFFHELWRGELRIFLRACCTSQERAYLRARLRREGPEKEAAALGVTHLPPREQSKARHDAWRRIGDRIRAAHGLTGFRPRRRSNERSR